MISISVCMIIKNEEDTLARILDCVNKFADEIIIVDTGSTDSSIEIAKKYTNKIYHFKWCNDFSKARNYSFSKATKEYIMWLDADDYISDSNIDKIIKLKNKKQSTDVFMFKYVMSFQDNTPTFSFYRERLLKRANNYVWCGFVHEAITPSGKIEYLDIEIEHRKLKHGDPKRNLKLYQIAIKNGYTFSPREQYYYSRELYYNAYYKKAIKEFRKYLNMNDRYSPNVIGAYTILGEIYLSILEPIMCRQTLLKCISKFTPTPEICCHIAKSFELEQNTIQAIYWYNSALICPHQSNGFINIKYNEFVPYIELCKLYYPINKEQAKHYHNLAKSIYPKHPSVIYNNQFFLNSF